MLTVFLLTAVLAGAPVQPATCRSSALAWTALGAAFGGMVGWAATHRSGNQTLYVGTGLLLGSGLGFAAEKACRPEVPHLPVSTIDSVLYPQVPTLPAFSPSVTSAASSVPEAHRETEGNGLP
jgi:hypothetical protein